ncbi:zinc metalloprotease [Seonamhaeicola sp.]|uniref:zinc metalloprotease n=1 Tax=Seonamhaeicola sp. TaxID=1912245 RepID=UPI002632CD8F|nr:zinc metalloprotease [Seonamhaeicola sp.]
MKKNILFFLVPILIFSCKSSENSNAQKLEYLLDQYGNFNDIQNIDSVFQNDILDLRATAMEKDDDAVVTKIDSILLEGESASKFMQSGEPPINPSDSDNVGGRKCRTVDNAPANVVRVKSNSLRLPKQPIEVNVAFHVIKFDNNIGAIEDSVLQKQLKVLNDNFSNTLFSFKLETITRTVNKDWYYKVDMETKEEKEMHRALAVDPKTTLNVYFVGNNSYLGYAQFPWEDKSNFDGVVIYNGSIPGGVSTNYNEGKTLTHEAGHYLGLWHTFHKGCSVGDNVADTPAQALSTEGCPQGKDTCPNLPGLDPIHNYMDYSYDSCMREFTAGQNNRMNWAVRKFRKELIINPT